jgi:riboflavin biosynthesis pyrimidine reductase
MPDLPETLRLAYHAERPHPRDVPLHEVYLDLDFPSGVGDRPFVYVNMVQTFDGQAVLKGTAYTIGTDVDHYLLRQLRVHADAVLCGAGTLRNDDVIIVTHPPLQERRGRAGKSPNPLAIVATATAEFSDEVLSTRKFFKRKDLDRLIVTTSQASPRAIERIRAAGVAVEVVDANPKGEVDLPRLLRWLRSRGIHCLLCEGGPTLNVSLAGAGALDNLFVTTALRLGGEADEPRIFSEPVTDRPLALVSEYQFLSSEGVRELYFHFQFPRS